MFHVEHPLRGDYPRNPPLRSPYLEAPLKTANG
uniref:Uncharacterized protein n=1 Tax=Myoviridae sp. ctPuP5 TaxID=2823543 RepID=A0A8S5L9K0_9CAUD|nr:MAG TPA: hypothetical protein [Myoviridae sp. ctPuP5]